ncbi:hypothetical protein ABTY20_27085 [Streptomyces sp. NPDC126497]
MLSSAGMPGIHLGLATAALARSGADHGVHPVSPEGTFAVLSGREPGTR